MMQIDEKLNKLVFLEEEVEKQIARMASKRERDKRRDFAVRSAAICFAAAITVLLGLQVNTIWSEVLRNIALVLGAIVTLLNAVDAFIDHHSLWVQRTVTLSDLYTLKREMTCYRIDLGQGEINMQMVDKFQERLNQILQEDLQAWLALRGGNAQKSEKQSIYSGMQKI